MYIYIFCVSSASHEREIDREGYIGRYKKEGRWTRSIALKIERQIEIDTDELFMLINGHVIDTKME